MPERAQNAALPIGSGSLPARMDFGLDRRGPRQHVEQDERGAIPYSRSRSALRRDAHQMCRNDRHGERLEQRGGPDHLAGEGARRRAARHHRPDAGVRLQHGEGAFLDDGTEQLLGEAAVGDGLGVEKVAPSTTSSLVVRGSCPSPSR